MKHLHQIREISTLSFNERVLQEGEDRRNPLLERLKFLGIFSSNMDEFFKVRVASMHRRLELGKRGMSSVLEVVAMKSQELEERFQTVYAEIIKELEGQGIRLLTERDVDEQAPDMASWLGDYFRENVLPRLVPIILRAEKAFPQLIDGSLYFGIKMWRSAPCYGILEVPAELPRFVELPNGNMMYLDDVIRYNLNDVFYIFDYERIEAFEFKISRDAELDIDNDFSEGYVRKMERVLRQRKGGRPVRLVFDAAMPEGLRQVLMKRLKVSKYDTLIAGGRYHNMKDLMRFPSRRADLKFEKQEAAPHPVLDNTERKPIFRLVKQQDLLVTYPYQSFDHIIRMLREAAIDPGVQRICMTLYRAAKTSQVVNALVNAARNGKEVFVSIELQARFDEENNIQISERLSEVGAQVVYGVPPMKVHAKLLLIQTKEDTYAALATGNFNENTGRLYVDSALLTDAPEICREVAQVFEFLEKAARVRAVSPPRFTHLLVSPFNSRKAIYHLLDREKAKGRNGYVFLKVNHLTDTKMIKRIRAAADAGVRMDLVVRTTYAMTPHPNIRAISILDRYLEHQRIYIFGRGKDRKVYLSSADLMERNMDWRVETAFPIYDAALQWEITQTMNLQIADTFKARILDEVQSNQYVGGGSDGRRAQEETYRFFQELAGMRVAPAESPVSEGA
ncbi:MAG: polyphosphate kinase 1 [Candidatus Hydrogenedentota bacterium]